MNPIPTAPDVTLGNPLMDALAASELLPAGQVRQLATRYAAWARSPSLDAARQLAERLVSAALLTPYQVEQLLAGRGRQLRLGQYHILEPIGAGGMGQVFKAEHQLMQRVVAVKLLSCNAPEGSNATFLREIRAAGRLHHPNIVTAFDADVDDGRLYLVMEYVPGVDLGRLVGRGGPLPVVLACEYVRQAALGLQAAYDQGLLHRDIKPSNLLVHNHHYPDHWPPASPAVVKLLDLGLACLTREANPGALAGTPEFMAPERGRDSKLLDVRSDLYSLGCTFFYLLTGRAPYRGGHWTETLVAHQQDPIPSPAALRPEVPATLCAKVMRLLSKDMDDRWDTPAKLAEELGVWLNDHAPSLLGTSSDAAAQPVAPTVSNLAAATPRPTSSWAAPPRVKRRWLTVAGVAGFAAALALGFHWLPRRLPAASDSPPPLPVQTQKQPPDGPRIAGRPERYRTLAQAIEAARDGDTIEIPAGQTLVSPALSWTGKALTLRAAPGERPRLLLESARAAEFWEALLTTDSTLTLEGLDLGHEPCPHDQRATAHLLSVRGPRLVLKNCHLVAPEAAAVIACREGGAVEVDGCEITALATAVSVELSAGRPTELSVRNSRLKVTDATAAALAVWATGSSGKPLRVTLEGNDFDAGRVLGLTGVPGQIEVGARRNRFRSRQALLSLAAWPVGEPWHHRVHWEGADNTYDEPSRRLLIDGVVEEDAMHDQGPRS